MSAMSNYLENKLIDHIFRAQAFGAPTTLYFALFTAAPTDAGGGTEVSGGSYARAAVTTSLTAFNGTHGNTTGASSGTGGNTTNAVAITFQTPTANWGTITHWAVFDAATGGNMLFYGALTNSKNVNNGDPAPSFPVGAFSLTLA